MFIVITCLTHVQLTFCQSCHVGMALFELWHDTCLYVNEKTVKAQIGVGVQTYEKYFGKKPRGIWLPECGYVPEADKYLKEFGYNEDDY